MYILEQHIHVYITFRLHEGHLFGVVPMICLQSLHLGVEGCALLFILSEHNSDSI